VALDLIPGQQVDHGRRELRVIPRQADFEIGAPGLEGRQDAALGVEQLLLDDGPGGWPRRPEAALAYYRLHKASIDARLADNAA